MSLDDTVTISEFIKSKALERRGEDARITQELVAGRAQLRTRIRTLAALYPFEDGVRSAQAMEALLEGLRSYVAISHRRVFRRIADGEERRVEVRDVAVLVYPSIEASTESILDLEFKFRKVDPFPRGKALTRELSALSKDLTRRFAHEDQMLAAMNSDSRRQAG